MGIKMNIGRVIISLVVWVGCLGVAITTLLTGSNIIGVIFPMIMAMGSTAVLWGQEGASRRASARQFSQFDGHPLKAKNESAYERKMRLLMEMMDDDEREDFKRSLKRQLLNDYSKRGHLIDGELPFDAEEYDYFDPDERQNR
jgi:hypothetical protein